MAYEHAYLYLRWGGDFGQTSSSGLDQWSAGVKIGSPVADVKHDPVALAVFLASVETALSTLHGATGAGTGTTCWLKWCTVARIGTDGHYNPDTQETIRRDRTPLPGNGTAIHPWNTAHVISLRTIRPRGAASNGRVYHPALSLSVDAATGRIQTTGNATRLGLFKALFDSINTAANTYEAGMRIIVASQVGSGRSAIVTTIRSDTRLDSIEARENNQPPVYSTVALA